MTGLLKKYTMGDMQCYYYLEKDTGKVELVLLPEGTEPLEWKDKQQEVDSLIQIKAVGDEYPGAYAGGKTLRQSGSVALLEYRRQYTVWEGDVFSVFTEFGYRKDCRVVHCLSHQRGTEHLECHVEFYNDGKEEMKLEMLSSFSVGGISPCLPGDGHGCLKVHRIRSVWSMEGRLETRTVEELQLEPSWSGHAIRSERFGEKGSMPVNQYFPYLVIEDDRNDIFWGVQLAHNASWQMEIYRKDDGLAVSGGLADREFGHWMKLIKGGEKFVTPAAILSVCTGGGTERISQRMTRALTACVNGGPESEQELPVIFNEYCTTWGCPSYENILRILDAIKGKGISYFVIDCGWYKKEGIPWDVMMGDYNVSKELFPEGLGRTVQAIRECGLKPGIWFEIENVGPASEAYKETEHLLKRDGEVLTTSSRRFWDMRDPWVMNYLSDRVIGTLKEYGFEYMKIDYNDTIGLGCDGAESLGEGLRQNMQASLEFINRVKKEVPGIILENCASGGHRLEPLMMGAMSMASFSDAHECEEIPVIAANLHRVILPRQSQIWAVIRKTDSLKRIAYSLANTFLGRMCISGDVTELDAGQWALIERGIAFYKKIAPIIRAGETFLYGSRIGSYRHLEGWQGVLRVSEKGSAYAVLHSFSGGTGEIAIPLPDPGGWKIEEIYSDTLDNEMWIEDGMLRCRVREEKKAVAVLIGR